MRTQSISDRMLVIWLPIWPVEGAGGECGFYLRCWLPEGLLLVTLSRLVPVSRRVKMSQ